MDPDPLHLLVPYRFQGPPGSGNGGWCSGALSAFLPGAAAVQVRLGAPPPLAVAMPVELTGGPGSRRAAVTGPDGPALSATEVSPAAAAALTVVPPVDLDLAHEAARRYDGAVEHPFPTCFVCGTDRFPGDGMRLTPGALRGRPDETACTWVPDDTVDLAQTWAAMDCPGAWSARMSGRTMVLGTMTAVVHRVPDPGERCVVTGRGMGTQGRKTRTAATLWSPAPGHPGGAELLATAEHVWITVDPQTFNT